ncbi:MAG: hypothetical protein RL203_36, partial [Pseudomonadota bacterium]
MSTHPYTQAFDLLATLVAVVRVDGKVVFANSALEDVLGVSKRHIEGDSLSQYFVKPAGFESVLKGAQT